MTYNNLRRGLSAAPEVTDHELDEPFGDLLTAQTIHHASVVGAPPGHLHDLAQASWAKRYPRKPKEGAAHMGGSFSSTLLEISANPAHRSYFAVNLSWSG